MWLLTGRFEEETHTGVSLFYLSKGGNSVQIKRSFSPSELIQLLQIQVLP